MFLNNPYILFSWGAFVSICFGFGLCFLLLFIPETKMLASYRVSRKVMGSAYIFMGLVNLIAFFLRDMANDLRLIQSINLILASSQTFFFTYTLIILLNVKFLTLRKVYMEIIPITFLSILMSIALFGNKNIHYITVFHIFLIYCIFLLIRYSILFFCNYRKYKQKMNNYFSGNETRLLYWVTISFCITLILEILLLAPTLFLSKTMHLLTLILYICFYLYFGIRFINYAFIFREIEYAIAIKDQIKPSSIPYGEIETAIVQWLPKKQFLEQGVNIKQVALQIGTNRTYLSLYINEHEKKTFKEWISYLRMQEAKRLFLELPDLPVGEVGNLVGIPDKSNFGRQFSRQTGKTPQTWKKQMIKKQKEVS